MDDEYIAELYSAATWSAVLAPPSQFLNDPAIVSSGQYARVALDRDPNQFMYWVRQPNPLSLPRL
jgi:hypothetical protein